MYEGLISVGKLEDRVTICVIKDQMVNVDRTAIEIFIRPFWRVKPRIVLDHSRVEPHVACV
jgi:hypothetical protein